MFRRSWPLVFSLLYILGATLAPAAEPARASAADAKAVRRAGIDSPGQIDARKTFRSKLDIAKGDSTAPASGGVALTTESLATMLENMGYEPKTGQYSDGSKYLSLAVARGTWTFGIGLDISPDKSQIWLSSYLAEVKEPDKVKPEPLMKLLEANNSVWPCYFVYFTQSKGLSLYRPLKNLDVKPALLKNTLEAHMNAIETTAPLWDVAKWTDSAPAAPAAPAATK